MHLKLGGVLQKRKKKTRLNSSAWMMAVPFQPMASCEKDTEVVEENPSEIRLHNS